MLGAGHAARIMFARDEPALAIARMAVGIVRRLAENANNIFRWFDKERRLAYPALAGVINDSYYEKQVIASIDEIIDESGNVKDSASETLGNIRMSLFRFMSSY